MIESQVPALFTEIARGEPGASRVDAQLALAVGAVLTGPVVPPGPGGPVRTGPPAPRQFGVRLGLAGVKADA